MRTHVLSGAVGAILATVLQFLLGMQTPGPSSSISGDVREFLSRVSMVDLPDGHGGSVRTVRIAGVNFQIVNGLGATESVNGAGNLIVGYREDGGSFLPDRTGSHNIVGGIWANYSSYGGLVVGEENWASGPFASVCGGTTNIAAGRASSVSGGSENDAIGFAASVSGGGLNRAMGSASWVGGGNDNRATALESAVSGGAANSASGRWSSVSGGAQRSGPGDFDWAAGSLFEDF